MDLADRLLVIGLDCASPWLLFEHLRADLPYLSGLMARGQHGRLRSCHPPITVPAWRVMASGKDAGHHGVYGFRNRSGPGYRDLTVAGAADFDGAVWETLGAHGLRTTLIGLPGTFPAPSLLGSCVSGPLTPDLDAAFAQPPALADHVRAHHPDYTFDVADHRLLSPEALLEAVDAMTEARFALARDLAARDDWNLLWLVEIGVDRLHHALWHHVDPTHPRYVPGSPLADALREHYVRLDAWIGELVALCDDGETAVMVVSDHGARPMVGGFCVNTWLEREGLLAFRPGARPEAPDRFDPATVDWSRTRAWGAGGYYARVFFNLQGREPEGIVPAAGVDDLAERIRQGLEALDGPGGAPMGNAVHRPSELFSTVNGRPPDLIAYLGDLAWRSLDTVGGGLFAEANDTGPDAANHDWDGVFIGAGPGFEPVGEVEGRTLLGVEAEIRRVLGV